jgi:hypothetical protein
MGGTPSGGQSSADLRQTRMARRQTTAAQGVMDLAGSQDVMNLAGAGLTPAEQMQMEMVGAGYDRAQQGIQQNVRDEASARGLFSSAGAIGQEAAQLAGLDTYMGQQRADIYGMAQQRQFQGLGMRSGLLGQAGGMYGQAGQSWGGVAGAQRQREQQAQQQQMGGLQAAAGLGMMFIPGMQGAGASMMAGGLSGGR